MIDPIQVLIDRQLRSLQGRLEEMLSLKTFTQASIKTEGMEDAFIEAIDQKWFSSGLGDERAARVMDYYLEGYTQAEIAVMEGCAQQTISRIVCG